MTEEHTLISNPYSSSCSTDNANSDTCFDISITDSIFKHFGRYATQTTTAVGVNSEHGMTHHGKILNLDNFLGNIYLKGNEFSYNILAFSECLVGE